MLGHSASWFCYLSRTWEIPQRNYTSLKVLPMTQHEFNPEAHEEFVSKRLENLRRNAARVAIFDELIDMHHDGMCTFDEAMAQFHHDLEADGLQYTTDPQPTPLK